MQLDPPSGARHPATFQQGIRCFEDEEPLTELLTGRMNVLLSTRMSGPLRLVILAGDPASSGRHAASETEKHLAIQATSTRGA